MNRHPAELTQIDSVLVKVAVDFDDWWEQRGKGEKRPVKPDDHVRIRISKYGTTLTVGGTDRTQVEGLTHRLAEALGRAATNSPGFDRGWLLAIPLPLCSIAFALAVFVVRWLGLAERNDRWETAEVVGGGAGIALWVGLSLGFWWLLPPVEIFDAGTPRAHRFRKWVLGTAGGLALAVIGSLIYDQVR